MCPINGHDYVGDLSASRNALYNHLYKNKITGIHDLVFVERRSVSETGPEF